MNALVHFLRRPGAAPTHIYEHRALWVLEALCLAALLAVAPTLQAAAVVLASGALAIHASDCAQTTRSGAARKAAALRREVSLRPPHFHPAWHRLACERQLERAAAWSQVHSAAAPLVALVGAAVLQGGVSRAAMVGAMVTLARATWAMETYPRWRAWWEARRSCAP